MLQEHLMVFMTNWTQPHTVWRDNQKSCSGKKNWSAVLYFMLQLLTEHRGFNFGLHHAFSRCTIAQLVVSEHSQTNMEKYRQWWQSALNQSKHLVFGAAPTL